MAQTWHQVRPGEIRNDCGGCHAHSQQPTDFNRTAAARPDFDIVALGDHLGPADRVPPGRTPTSRDYFKPGR
jgi:hypothetical protein